MAETMLAEVQTQLVSILAPQSGPAPIDFILLVLSVMMVNIIAVKFIASKFVICQVPCYAEGETSLRRTIDLLTQLKYDDKCKLVLFVCDGDRAEYILYLIV
jgi:hypothetical protein